MNRAYVENGLLDIADNAWVVAASERTTWTESRENGLLYNFFFKKTFFEFHVWPSEEIFGESEWIFWSSLVGRKFESDANNWNHSEVIDSFSYLRGCLSLKSGSVQLKILIIKKSIDSYRLPRFSHIVSRSIPPKSRHVGRIIKFQKCVTISAWKNTLEGTNWWPLLISQLRVLHRRLFFLIGQ